VAVVKYFLDNYKITLIADLSSGRFDNVTASTSIISLENDKANGHHEVKIVEDFDFQGASVTSTLKCRKLCDRISS